MYPAELDVAITGCGNMTTQTREAWELKHKVVLAREAYDSEIPSLAREISAAECAAECAKADITKVKARIRLQRAQTPEQTRTLHEFQQAYKDAQEEEVYIRQRAQVLFDDVRKFEGRLLQVLMSFQLRCHNPYAKTAPASTEDQCRLETSDGYERVQGGGEKPKQCLSADEQTMAEDTQVFARADTAWVQQSTPGLRVPENAHVQVCAPKMGPASAQHDDPVMPKSPHQGDDDFAGEGDRPVFHRSGQSVAQASEDSSDCATPCISGPVSFGSVPRPAPTIEIHLNPTSPKSDHGGNHEQSTGVTNPVLAHSVSKGHYSPPPSKAFKHPYALSAPEAPKEVSHNVQEDNKKLKALQELERREKQYWDAGQKLDTHYDTYDEQLEACYRRNGEPDRPCDVLEDEFAQEYLQRSNAISKEHTSAKQRMQVARRLAVEAGVNDPNSWDQESGFVPVPGEGPSPSWDAHVAQQFDGIQVRRWLNNENATSKLETVEAQFALSGAEVDVWESSSTRGDAHKRKKIDAHNDAHKRRKLDAGASRRLPNHATESAEPGSDAPKPHSALGQRDRRAPQSLKRRLRRVMSESDLREYMQDISGPTP